MKERGESSDEGTIAEGLPEQEVYPFAMIFSFVLAFSKRPTLIFFPRFVSFVDIDSVGVRDDGAKAGGRRYPTAVQPVVGRIPWHSVHQGGDERPEETFAQCLPGDVPGVRRRRRARRPMDGQGNQLLFHLIFCYVFNGKLPGSNRRCSSISGRIDE